MGHFKGRWRTKNLLNTLRKFLKLLLVGGKLHFKEPQQIQVVLSISISISRHKLAKQPLNYLPPFLLWLQFVHLHF
jgi:hypothetical protein